jgi:cysteine desulfurase
MACAPHKFGGPRGIGALVIRAGSTLEPQAPGTQELGMRGGTEAVALAVGFARSLELADAERTVEAGRLATLRATLEDRLAAAAAAAGFEARVVGGTAPRAPHIATISFPGLDRQALVMAADLEGLCLASGTACASGSATPAPALVAMGLPAAVALGAVRISLGRTTTEDDVTEAVDRLGRVFRRLRA